MKPLEKQLEFEFMKNDSDKKYFQYTIKDILELTTITAIGCSSCNTLKPTIIELRNFIKGSSEVPIVSDFAIGSLSVYIGILGYIGAKKFGGYLFKDEN